MSFRGSGNAGSTSSTGPRFQNKNLNATLRPPSSFTKDKLPSGPPKSGLAVFVGKARTGKTIGTGAVPAAAPTPLNTPSLKRENGGKDPTVAIIPTGSSAVWGNSSSNNNERGVPSPPNDQSPPTWRSSSTNNASSAAAAASSTLKPAPWAKGDGKPEVENHVEGKPMTSMNARSRAKSWADDDSDEDDDEDTRAPGNSNQQNDSQHAHQQADQWPNNFREDIDQSHGPQHGYDRGNNDRYGGPQHANRGPNNMNRGNRSYEGDNFRGGGGRFEERGGYNDFDNRGGGGHRPQSDYDRGYGDYHGGRGNNNHDPRDNMRDNRERDPRDYRDNGREFRDYRGDPRDSYHHRDQPRDIRDQRPGGDRDGMRNAPPHPNDRFQQARPGDRGFNGGYDGPQRRPPNDRHGFEQEPSSWRERPPALTTPNTEAMEYAEQRRRKLSFHDEDRHDYNNGGRPPHGGGDNWANNRQRPPEPAASGRQVFIVNDGDRPRGSSNARPNDTWERAALPPLPEPEHERNVLAADPTVVGARPPQQPMKLLSKAPVVVAPQPPAEDLKTNNVESTNKSFASMVLKDDKEEMHESRMRSSSDLEKDLSRPKRMLFDPKSSQLVDPAENTKTKAVVSDNNKPKPVTASPTVIVNKKEKLPVVPPVAEKVVESDGKWAKVNMWEKKEETPATVHLKDTDTSNFEKRKPERSARSFGPESSGPPERERHSDDYNNRRNMADHQKELRNRERETRGPRSKGLLFRYNDKGEIEQVFVEPDKFHKVQDEVKVPTGAKTLADTKGEDELMQIAEALNAKWEKDSLEVINKAESVVSNSTVVDEVVGTKNAAPLKPAWTAPKATLEAISGAQPVDVAHASKSSVTADNHKVDDVIRRDNEKVVVAVSKGEEPIVVSEAVALAQSSEQDLAQLNASVASLLQQTPQQAKATQLLDQQISSSDNNITSPLSALNMPQQSTPYVAAAVAVNNTNPAVSLTMQQQLEQQQANYMAYLQSIGWQPGYHQMAVGAADSRPQQWGRDGNTGGVESNDHNVSAHHAQQNQQQAMTPMEQAYAMHNVAAAQAAYAGMGIPANAQAMMMDPNAQGWAYANYRPAAVADYYNAHNFVQQQHHDGAHATTAETQYMNEVAARNNQFAAAYANAQQGNVVGQSPQGAMMTLQAQQVLQQQQSAVQQQPSMLSQDAVNAVIGSTPEKEEQGGNIGDKTDRSRVASSKADNNFVAREFRRFLDTGSSNPSNRTQRKTTSVSSTADVLPTTNVIPAVAAVNTPLQPQAINPQVMPQQQSGVVQPHVPQQQAHTPQQLQQVQQLHHQQQMQAQHLNAQQAALQQQQQLATPQQQQQHQQLLQQQAAVVHQYQLQQQQQHLLQQQQQYAAALQMQQAAAMHPQHLAAMQAAGVAGYAGQQVAMTPQQHQQLALQQQQQQLHPAAVQMHAHQNQQHQMQQPAYQHLQQQQMQQYQLHQQQLQQQQQHHYNLHHQQQLQHQQQQMHQQSSVHPVDHMQMPVQMAGQTAVDLAAYQNQMRYQQQQAQVMGDVQQQVMQGMAVDPQQAYKLQQQQLMAANNNVQHHSNSNASLTRSPQTQPVHGVQKSSDSALSDAVDSLSTGYAEVAVADEHSGSSNDVRSRHNTGGGITRQHSGSGNMGSRPQTGGGRGGPSSSSYSSNPRSGGAGGPPTRHGPPAVQGDFVRGGAQGYNNRGPSSNSNPNRGAMSHSNSNNGNNGGNRPAAPRSAAESPSPSLPASSVADSKPNTAEDTTTNN